MVVLTVILFVVKEDFENYTTHGWAQTTRYISLTTTVPSYTGWKIYRILALAFVQRQILTTAWEILLKKCVGIKVRGLKVLLKITVPISIEHSSNFLGTNVSLFYFLRCYISWYSFHASC